MLPVMLIGVVGAALALQGWRSRIVTFDLITTIASAHDLVASYRIPDRGVLTSFVSFSPPGAIWLMAPGLLFFKDPRLFEYVGSVALYFGALAGIFLICRRFLGYSCGVLSVILYGLSTLGLTAAGSLWQRYPIHCFYVWMVYFLARWVSDNNPKFLGAALLTWSAGVYIFLEIAPAILIVPVLWLFNRPAVRVVPILAAGVLSLVFWYPYLGFQTRRDFADVRSQVLQRSLRQANFQQSWCNPSLAPAFWQPEKIDLNLDPSLISRAQNGSQAPIGGAVQTAGGGGAIERLASRATGRVKALASGLLVGNLRTNTNLTGMDVVLFIVMAAGLLLSGVRYWYGPVRNQVHREDDPGALFKWAGVATAAAAVVANEFVVARIVSGDGVLEASTLLGVRVLQVVLLAAGFALVAARKQLGQWTRGAIAAFQGTPRMDVVAISFLVPWLFLLMIVAGNRSDRLWWLWPIQVIGIASVVTYWPAKLGAPRFIAWVGSAILIFALVGNPLFLSKVQSWSNDGWAGVERPEMQLMDAIASRVQASGKSQTHIGYELYDDVFYLGTFNQADPRYKIGAQFDTLLKYRHGIENLDTCAEGVSDGDEFRIVEAPVDGTPYPIDQNGMSAVARKFELIGQAGIYQLYQASPASRAGMASR